MSGERERKTGEEWMKFFENKRNRGAVSIFLVMILLPTMLLCAVLIDGSRVASARAMTQEAADLAATSALAVYNQKLKDDYGLFAVKEPEKLEKIYKESLEATLLASGLSEDEAYSEKLWGIMKDTVGLNNPYEGKNFLNLYDFKVDSCKVEPKYPLAEKDVLQNQMVEYAKYRGIYIMADRLSILSNLGSAKKQAEETKEATEVMEDKMTVDESNAAADQALADLMESVSNLNESVATVSYMKERYFIVLPEYMEKVKLENTDIEGEYDKEKVREYNDILDSASDMGQLPQIVAVTVLYQAKTAKSKLEDAVKRLKQFQEENKSKSQNNEAVAGLVEDAGKEMDYYQNTCLPLVEKILSDSTIDQISKDTELGSRIKATMEKIEKAVERYIQDLADQAEEAADDESDDSDGEDEEENLEYYYYYLDLSSYEENPSTVISGGSNVKKYYRPAITELIKYFEDKSWPCTAPAYEKQNDDSKKDKIDQDFASKESSKEDESKKEDGGPERGEIKSDYYKDRPSKTYVSEAGAGQKGGFYNEKADLSGAKSALKGGENSMLLQAAEATRDEVLSLSYMFGTFKTRMTGIAKFSKKGMSQTEKDNKYMPEWRYAHDDGEIDMRFSPKKDRKTVLRSEIEYIIYGNRTDLENESAVYATIFAERLAFNVWAMYREKGTINPSCHTAAAAASAALKLVGVIVPEQVFFWIFLTAWATAETSLEMNYLIDCGYKIPLMKTEKNILLKDIPTGDGPIDNYGDPKKGLFVTYEDYLLIMLLLKFPETRIMRSADLIEVNMKNNGEESFAMNNAFTYLKADSQMSSRYLFGSTAPFKADYEANGVTGRMKYTNTIYQGY